MLRTHKTAVAIPSEDYEQIELLRKKTGQSRSRLLLEAFHAWLELQKNKELEDLYEEGYRRKPENVADIEGGMKAGLGVWKKETW